MKRNGVHALDFHGPALIERQLTYLHGWQLIGRVIALCFLPYHKGLSAAAIDRHAARLHEVGATLLLVRSGALPLHQWWTDRVNTPRSPLLPDPGGRLHRSFGVKPSAMGCRTFVIDPDGILRLCVSHEFVDGDLEALRKIVESTHHNPSQRGLGPPASDSYSSLCALVAGGESCPRES